MGLGGREFATPMRDRLGAATGARIRRMPHFALVVRSPRAAGRAVAAYIRGRRAMQIARAGDPTTWAKVQRPTSYCKAWTAKSTTTALLMMPTTTNDNLRMAHVGKNGA